MTSVASSPCLSEERVAELVEGRLDDDDLASADRHLAECAECRGFVSSMARVIASSDGTGDPTAWTTRDASSVLRPDDRVGRYVVLRLVGVGGMGRVYAAHDPALDRTIALKLLRPEVAIPDLESRLLREAKAMARVSHPHVIAVHDAGRHGDQVYIAMELVAGGTLRDWLGAKARSWREILDVYVRAGRGLAEAHAAGVVHRDFKPDNVLVGDDGVVVRVTDFGLARAASGSGSTDARHDEPVPASDAGGSLDFALTRTGALVGTPAYMAPEQHAGEVADARADVYSFCVALYEGLYGERPFVAGTLAALRAAKDAGEVRRVTEGRGIPKRVRRVLVAGLRAKPEDRYASMDALLADLGRASRASRAPFAIAGAIVAAAAAASWFAFGGVRSRPAPVAPSAALVSLPPECTTNRACVELHGGAPWRCRSDRTCASIASDECVARFEPGDLEADDTVWLGAMFPTKGPVEPIGSANANAIELARREIAHATRALTGSNASLRVRRIALALCDDSDANGAQRAALHLVDDVGVPAVLGFRSGQEVMDLTGSLFVRRNVVAVASLTTSPLITRLPQPPDLPRMVWRTTFSLDDVAVATAAMIHEFFEPRRARVGPMRVALVRGDAPGLVAFGQTFLKRLVFNDKSGVDNGADYQEIALAADLTADASDDVSRAADRIVATSPSFVVLLASAEARVPLVSAIESRWRDGAPRPIYLLAADVPDLLASFVGASAERRRRIFGVVSTSASTANAQFVSRYNDAHAKQVSRTENPGSSYDAFYVLALAAHALGDEPISGPALARAFARLVPPGRSVDVGPTQVFEALSELARGGHVDLEGADTALDFDLATGDAPSDFALVCAATDRAGRASGESVESGLVFRAKSRRVEGTLRCP